MKELELKPVPPRRYVLIEGEDGLLGSDQIMTEDEAVNYNSKRAAQGVPGRWTPFASRSGDAA